MNAITDFRTWVSPKPKLPPEPQRRIIPPMADLETTLAAMKADAQIWKKRKAKAWGEVGNENTGSSWNNALRMSVARERDEAMFPIILAILQDGPKSRIEIARGTGLSDDTSKRVLQRMKNDGLIVGTGRHKIKWSRAT